MKNLRKQPHIINVIDFVRHCIFGCKNVYVCSNFVSLFVTKMS